MANMKFEVYHARELQSPFASPPPFDVEHYELVARVECDCIEDVFLLTNHVDRSWRSNPEVEVLTEGRVRSTSVGDVIVDEGGVTLRCASWGWDVMAS